MTSLSEINERIHTLATRRQAHQNWAGVSWTAPPVRMTSKSHLTGIHKELDELYQQKRALLAQRTALPFGAFEDAIYEELLRREFQRTARP